MLKQKIDYIDLDGVKRSEIFYFNLTKAELIEFNLEVGDGFQEKVRLLSETQDVKTLLDTFKDLIIRSYGRREGGNFVKDPREAEIFTKSEAYSELIVSFFSDANAAVDFIKGLLPQDIATEAMAKMQSSGASSGSEVSNDNQNSGEPVEISGSVSDSVQIVESDFNELDKDRLAFEEWRRTRNV